jgi:predicted  nucleic acid-binding Zn-ribbon protein
MKIRSCQGESKSRLKYIEEQTKQFETAKKEIATFSESIEKLEQKIDDLNDSKIQKDGIIGTKEQEIKNISDEFDQYKKENFLELEKCKNQVEKNEDSVDD